MVTRMKTTRNHSMQCPKDILHHVQTAVFSHLGVDPLEAKQMCQFTPKGDAKPVELHVHHHHHLYVDKHKQQIQPPNSPQTPATAQQNGIFTPQSKSMSKGELDEMANKTLLDIMWSKNQPYYNSQLPSTHHHHHHRHRRKDEELNHDRASQKAAAQDLASRQSLAPPFDTVCYATTTEFDKQSGDKVLKDLNSPAKNRWQEIHTINGPSKKSSSRRSVNGVPTATAATESAPVQRIKTSSKQSSSSKSKIRTLEEAAQERIKKLSALGSLYNSAEGGFKEDNSNLGTTDGRRVSNTCRRREAASQTPNAGNIYVYRTTKNADDDIENDAKKPFIAAAKASKERLRSLVNECANANTRQYGAASRRQQKELQALEKLRSCFEQDGQEQVGATDGGNVGVGFGARDNNYVEGYVPYVNNTMWDPYVPFGRPPSPESVAASEVAASSHYSSASQASDERESSVAAAGAAAASYSEYSNGFSDHSPHRATPSQASDNASLNGPYESPTADFCNNAFNVTHNKAFEVDEVVERYQNSCFPEHYNQPAIVRKRLRSRPTRFGRKPEFKDDQVGLQQATSFLKEKPVKRSKGKSPPPQPPPPALAPVQAPAPDLAPPQAKVEPGGISCCMEYMRMFRDQGREEKSKDEFCNVKVRSRTTMASIQAEVSKMMSGLDLNSIQTALHNLDRKLTNVENLKHHVVQVLKEKGRVVLPLSSESYTTPTTGVLQLEAAGDPYADCEKRVEVQTLKEEINKLRTEMQQVRERTENLLVLEKGDTPMLLEKVAEEKCDDEHLLQKISGVLVESENLRGSLEETRKLVLEENKRNESLREKIGSGGDEERFQRETIINSAHLLNIEMATNISQTEDALTQFRTSSSSLLPFFTEQLHITKTLENSLQERNPVQQVDPVEPETSSEITDRIEAFKKAAEMKRRQIDELLSINQELLAFAQAKEDELATITKEADSDGNAANRNAYVNAQTVLIKEIEETKRQSKEMVVVMDSLQHHFGILKEKFTEMESEMIRREERMSTCHQHPVCSSSSLEEDVSEYGFKDEMDGLSKKKRYLEERLQSLEKEISTSHAQVEELESENIYIKDMVQNKEKEANAMRKESGDIKWKLLHLEEELMEKEGQIAMLRGNLLADSD